MDKFTPNFLIVGAPKCGTTALYRYLQEHPQVFMPSRKEPYYFIQPKNIIGHGPGNLSWRNMLNSESEYQELFAEAFDGKYAAVGEASAGYLYFHKEAIPQIKKELGDPKIIILIRDPVARSFSSHIHHVREGREEKKFKEAWMAQEERARLDWWFGFQLKAVSLYYESISSYLQEFNNVKIILQDDFLQRTEEIVSSVFDFLGVDRSVKVRSHQRHNRNLLPRFVSIQRGIRKFERHGLPSSLARYLDQLNSYKPLIPSKFAREICPEFEEDLTKTGMLIGRNLTKWLDIYR